jgi:hypothetical protein
MFRARRRCSTPVGSPSKVWFRTMTRPVVLAGEGDRALFSGSRRSAEYRDHLVGIATRSTRATAIVELDRLASDRVSRSGFQ